jgi:hypothetical protein
VGGEESTADDKASWSAVQLDVACNQSGKMPHQAVMSFNKTKGGVGAGSMGDIFKIQVAQGAEDDTPMLMYNENKTRKTFIHPNCAGYTDIKRMILDDGQNGALKQTGGLKAFFWARHHRKLGRKFIYVNTHELAPSQPW